MADPNAHAGEARRQPLGRTFPPPDRVPGIFGQITRQAFGCDQMRLVVSSGIVERPASPPRSGAGWPNQDFRLNADDVTHAQCRHAGAQPRVSAIGAVHQCHPAWQACFARPSYLIEGDLRLGLEADVPWHACLVPARPVLDPFLRQIQPISYRQAGGVVCDRQRHRHLTIGFFAELSAILMLHPYRMLSLFGKTRVVDDPRFDRPLPFHCRQHHLAHLGQHPLIRPRCDTDKMQQRLMLCCGPRRSSLRRHRLHAFAFTRQDQPGAIVAQWANPVGVPEHSRKTLHIRCKSYFGSLFAFPIHVSTSRANPESSQIVDSQSRSVRPSDSVRLMAVAEPVQRRSEAVAGDNPQALMSVRGLGIRFKTSHGVWQATHKIDFDIAPGERVGIVGESGCGKTITGLSILRLLPNNLAGLDGSILFDGIDLASCGARAMRAIRGRRIAMIFQEPMSALDPVFTVGHQIAETLRVHTGIGKDEARAKTLDMLRRVGIASPERRIDDYPHQLSGGMRQRVMIAAALICGPQLLIADEPTTALDVTVQAQILELLRPLHPYTSGLLRSLPHLSPRHGKLPSIPGRVPSIMDMPNGCRFKARCPHAVAGCEAEQALLDAGNGRKVRCWRFRELDLPGALQYAASAPIAAMAAHP